MIQQSHQSMDMWKMSTSLLSSNGIPWAAIRHDLHNKPDLRVQLAYRKPNLANYGTRLCTIWEKQPKQNPQQNPPSHTLTHTQRQFWITNTCTLTSPLPIKHSGTLEGRFFAFLVWICLCCSLSASRQKSKLLQIQPKGFPGLFLLTAESSLPHANGRAFNVHNFIILCIVVLNSRDNLLPFIKSSGERLRKLYLFVPASCRLYSPKNKTHIREEKKFLYQTILYTCKSTCLHGEIACRQD